MLTFLVNKLSSEAVRRLRLASLNTICYPSEASADPLAETRGSGRGKRVGHRLTLGEEGLSHEKGWLGKFFSGPSYEGTPSFRIILSREGDRDPVIEGEVEESFEVYRGHTITDSNTAFETLRDTLGPLLETGTIPASEQLLVELLLPSPKPLADLPSILLKVDGGKCHTYINEKFDRKTLLHLACEKGDHESVKNLLESGASVEATHEHTGHTPLHTAAVAKHALKALVHMLDHAKKILIGELRSKFLNRPDSIGYTALHLACLHNNPDAVDALVKAGAKLTIPAVSGSNPLHIAAKDDCHECISAINRKYEYLNTREDDGSADRDNSMNGIDSNGDTPVLVAIRKDHIKSALALLLEGADPNHPNTYTLDSPLHVAALIGNITMVQLLLVFGANPTSKNQENKTPLQKAQDSCAAEDKKQQCIEALETVIRGRAENEFPESQLEEVAPAADDTVFLLSLDGGGVKGLVLSQLLLAIEERMDKLCPDHRPLSAYFNWIGGSSTGAFLGLAFALYNTPPAVCRKMYFKFKHQALAGHRIYPAPDLEITLKEAFGHTAVMADVKGPRICITTCLANQSPPQLHLIRNYSEAKHDQPGSSEWLVWEAARASSAAPTYFPAFRSKFLDGGVIANNPTLDVMAEVFSEAKKENREIKIGCVLSLGSGIEPLVPLDGVSVVNPYTPSAILQDVKAIKDLAELFIAHSTNSDGQEVTRSQAWCNSMGTPYFRFSPCIDAVQLNETDNAKLIKLMFVTLTYTFEKRKEIDELVRLLLSKRQ